MDSTSTPPSPSPARLEVRGVTVTFGEARALDAVDLAVAPGQVVGVVGSNGAGKTTLLDVIDGATQPTRGSLAFDGTRFEPSTKASAEFDIARTRQDLALPAGKSVLDVVLDGAAPPPRTGLGTALRAVFGAAPDASDHGFHDHAAQLIASLGLARFADEPVEALSQALRARVAVARATVANPRLLLLDEPAAGLDPDGRAELSMLIRSYAIRPGRDCAVVLVEHHFDVVAAACDTVVVLDAGRVIASGTPDEVQRDPRVLETYFG